MPNILDHIIATKHQEVEEAKRLVSLSELEERIARQGKSKSLRHSLETHRGGIIAEFKRRSPSKDWIKREARVEDIIPAYEKAGAAGLSILTDRHYFGGSLDDVARARTLTALPILRKEFVIDAYQLYEARSVGADACLLIAAAIGAERCKTLAKVAHEVGLEVVLEVHSLPELEAYSDNVDIIGVNNRNLKVFKTDPQQSADLFAHLPQGPLPISESGLLDPLVAHHLQGVGYRGFLVGEAFMRTPQPGEALAAYIQHLD